MVGSLEPKILGPPRARRARPRFGATSSATHLAPATRPSRVRAQRASLANLFRFTARWAICRSVPVYSKIVVVLRWVRFWPRGGRLRTLSHCGRVAMSYRIGVAQTLIVGEHRP